LDEINIANPEFQTEKYGKAYLSNYPNIHFNLSHSGKYVACAIADTHIGVDIEYNDPEIDLNIAKNYFFNSEYKRIIESENPSNEFFSYWVLKESYMKYTGLGFNLKLDEFEIIMENEDIKLKDDKNNLKFNLFDVDNYKLAFACKQKTDKIIEYDIEKLYPIS
jgi:4'-phosphopantetheinyl transferase